MITGEELYPEGIETPAPSGGSFEIPPAGVYTGVCALFMDLGIQETMYGDKHRVKYVFLLNEEDSQGKPYMIFSRPLNLSSHDKGSLYKLLKGWNVVPMTFEGNGSFSMGFLPAHIGQSATINVVHNESGDKTYANIESISPPMKGIEVAPIDDERIDKLVDNIRRNGGIYLREENAPAHTDLDAPHNIEDAPII